MGMLGHPPKKELLEYAEGLASGRVLAKTARHVAGCTACARETNAMRASFEFAASAPALNPGRDMTARILAAGRDERRAIRHARSRRQTVFALAKGVVFAAAMVALCALSFQAALLPDTTSPATRSSGEALRVATKAPSPEELKRTAEAVETLAEAVHTPGDVTPAATNLGEWRHRRTVRALDADLAAALASLERNPGCERAGQVVNSNLRRQAQALKALYAERSL